MEKNNDRLIEDMKVFLILLISIFSIADDFNKGKYDSLISKLSYNNENK